MAVNRCIALLTRLINIMKGSPNPFLYPDVIHFKELVHTSRRVRSSPWQLLHNYQYKLRNIPEEKRSNLHSGGRLKSRKQKSVYRWPILFATYHLVWFWSVKGKQAQLVAVSASTERLCYDLRLRIKLSSFYTLKIYDVAQVYFHSLISVLDGDDFSSGKRKPRCPVSRG